MKAKWDKIGKFFEFFSTKAWDPIETKCKKDTPKKLFLPKNRKKIKFNFENLMKLKINIHFQETLLTDALGYKASLFERDQSFWQLIFFFFLNNSLKFLIQKDSDINEIVSTKKNLPKI